MRWRAFPLHPETPLEGKSLEDLFAGTTINVPEMLQHLKSVADSLGLPFGRRERTYNSRLAQELGLWAEAEGQGHAFHMAAFRAYFAAGENLAKKDVLLKIISDLRLDPDQAARVIETRLYRSAVDADWELSRKKGITAVPTFMVGDAKLTGAQPYNDLLRFINQQASGLKEKG